MRAVYEVALRCLSTSLGMSIETKSAGRTKSLGDRFRVTRDGVSGISGKSWHELNDILRYTGLSLIFCRPLNISSKRIKKVHQYDTVEIQSRHAQ